MTSTPVVVAGAGIAGLVTAIAFARRGVAVTLVERSTSFEEVGAGLQLSPNATRVLTELGVSQGLARTAVAPERFELRNWDDPRSFCNVPLGSMQELFGSPFWVARRADLQIALVDVMRGLAGIRLLVGRTVETVETDGPEGAGIVLVNAKGERERLAASLVVGADGLWSSVRSALGDTRSPAFTGYEAWRTLIPIELVPEFARQPSIALWMGSNRHAVHYPVEAGRRLNLVVIRSSTQGQPGWDTPPAAGDISQLAKGAAGTLAQLVAAAPGWRRWSLYDRPPALMSGHSVALVGDAAHPILPFLAQGAALAIEDGAELAGLTSRALLDGDQAALKIALQRYDRLRRPRAARVQDAARANGRNYHMSGPFALARDLVIRGLGPEGMLRRFDWIYGWKGTTGH